MIWRTHLCEVFADVLGSITQIVTERTGISGLTSTLTKELARNVRGVYSKQVVSVGTTVWYGMAGERSGRVQHATKQICHNMTLTLNMRATYSEGFEDRRSGELQRKTEECLPASRRWQR